MMARFLVLSEYLLSLTWRNGWCLVILAQAGVTGGPGYLLNFHQNFHSFHVSECWLGAEAEGLVRVSLAWE